jgi:hypothetical protein
VSDPGVDVDIDVVAVRRERRRSQLCLLCREPSLDEVVAERDAFWRPVVAIVHTLDEFAEHLLGGLACRAGRVPPVALVAGGWVDAFVDDGVVTVAPASDVSPHGPVLCRLVTVGVDWYARMARHRWRVVIARSTWITSRPWRSRATRRAPGREHTPAMQEAAGATAVDAIAGPIPRDEGLGSRL